MSPAAMEVVGQLHLLRPGWLWALAALPLLIWLWQQRQRRASVWRDAVDPHLLPHLLESGGRSGWSRSLVLGMLGYVLAVFALAGPSWRQTEQPLWQSSSPLVIALDLSSATLAGDLPPSRLAQARSKLATLLAEREGGQVGLVVYAGDAFTVAPLTEDAGNVALFIDALHPQVMPVDGQSADRAIAWSARLLRQAGFEQGDILLITDHADAQARAAAERAQESGFRVSVLGMGTPTGAPYRQQHGGIATARLDGDSLRDLAQAGGGNFAVLSGDDRDLQSLGVLDPDTADTASGGSERGRSWHDDGYWLLLPLMLLALFAFRRGSTLAVLMFCLWLPWYPATAAGSTAVPDTSGGLWRRPDQVAHEVMREAAEAYREGDYAAAAKKYRALESADAHYNLGNALAKAGRYPEAIEAYDQALRQQPGMEDAIANRRAVEAAMKRQPPPGPQKGQQELRDKPEPGPQQGPGEDGDPSGQQSSESGKPKDQPEQKPPSGEETEPTPSKGAEPADSRSQQEADEAQRERMRQALEQADGERGEEPVESEARAGETPAERERRLANEAWLRRVPDDPGGLLREKFRIEHQRRQSEGTGE
ncbi:MAG: VWA domain-containing protein [Pseudomonadota bacterium]|nr:VWA domain-containing protein [Pseudomonadota bacterium]